jgi:hypothetical protein
MIPAFPPTHNDATASGGTIEMGNNNFEIKNIF